MVSLTTIPASSQNMASEAVNLGETKPPRSSSSGTLTFNSNSPFYDVGAIKVVVSVGFTRVLVNSWFIVRVAVANVNSIG
jgi:hypothetical protein